MDSQSRLVSVLSKSRLIFCRRNTMKLNGCLIVQMVSSQLFLLCVCVCVCVCPGDRKYEQWVGGLCWNACMCFLDACGWFNLCLRVSVHVCVCRCVFFLYSCSCNSVCVQKKVCHLMHSSLQLAHASQPLGHRIQKQSIAPCHESLKSTVYAFVVRPDRFGIFAANADIRG